MAHREAAFHAIRGLCIRLSEEIGKLALAMRMPDKIQSIVAQCLVSRLPKHFIVSSRLLEVLADAIPDDMVDAVFSFVLPFAQTDLNRLTRSDTARPAWRVLKKLSPLLSKQQCNSLFEHIHNIEVKNAQLLLVEEILDVLNGIVTRLEGNKLAQSATFALSFVPDQVQLHHSMYYAEALNTVAHIASVAGEEIKRYIGDRLFPPGTTQMDVTRLQLYPLFKQVQAEEEWIKTTFARAAEVVRSQVTETPLGNDSTPTYRGSITSTEPLGNGNQRIVTFVGQNELRTAAAFVDYVAEDTITELFDACLEMLASEYNMLVSRIIILEVFPQIQSKLLSDQYSKLWDVVLLLSKGQLVREADRQKADQAGNPFSAFRDNFGSPSQLQGEAIVCLVRMNDGFNEAQQIQLLNELHTWLVSPDTDIRLSATRASTHLKTADDQTLIALICSLRDPNPQIALQSYASLCKKQSITLNDFYTNLILTTINLATVHPEVAIREWAAFLTHRMIEWLPDEAPAKPRFMELQRNFANDVSHVVRTWSHKTPSVQEQVTSVEAAQPISSNIEDKG